MTPEYFKADVGASLARETLERNGVAGFGLAKVPLADQDGALTAA